jgi:hypothetical protein
MKLMLRIQMPVMYAAAWISTLLDMIVLGIRGFKSSPVEKCSVQFCLGNVIILHCTKLLLIQRFELAVFKILSVVDTSIVSIGLR